MPARITQFLVARDASELIRDEIAAILAVENANQQALALAQLPVVDPRTVAIRVFLERSAPWAEFTDCPDQVDAAPIVNVSLDSINYEMPASNIVEHQKATATFHIDCYGYGVSSDDGEEDTGHDPGDEIAAVEAQRAVRIVRQYLMSAHYTYLGLPRKAQQFVWRRWIQSINFFKPQFDNRSVQHVIGGRIAFQVEFSEVSPQVIGEILEILSLTVKRRSNGEVYLNAQYGEPEEEAP